MAGADYLSSIFGTEKDKVNCSFYFKIGACRHGDKCERRHNKPTSSQTLILFGIYPNPQVNDPTFDPNEAKNQEDFEEFYLDIFEELEKFGEIEEMNVCENVCEHMLGNIYVKYRHEDDAERALTGLTGRFYGGKPIVAEFSPVTDFREASCRQFEMNECTRGGHCNFIHLKSISRDLFRYLYSRRSKHSSSSHRRSRSPDHHRHRHRERDHHRDRERDRDHRDRHHREEHREYHREERERDPSSLPHEREYLDEGRGHSYDRDRSERDFHRGEGRRDYEKEHEDRVQAQGFASTDPSLQPSDQSSL